MFKTTGRRALFLTLTVLAVCLFCSCGQAQNETGNGNEIKKEAEMKTEIQDESEVKMQAEPKVNVEDEFQDEAISGEAPQPEEEPAAAKEEFPADFLMIDSGKEFALMRNSYELDNLGSDASVIVVFSEDLEEWPEEELEALGMLKCSVYVESRGKTVPAKVLSYFTGATGLYFSYESDMTDVSGTMPGGKCFPQQIKKVRLRNYREEKYKTLLKLLQDSQVEAILVDSNGDTDSRDSDKAPKKLPGFWLDDVAGISTLKDLTLYGTAIRVRDEKALEGSGVERIEGCADQKTAFAFAAGISLYLDIYGDCPVLYQAVSWPEEVRGEGKRHIYQRRYDQGRVAECFTELPDGMEVGSKVGTERKNPVLRITDGAAAYEIKPEEGTLIRYQEKIFENGEVVEVKNAYAVRIEGEETGIPAGCEKYYAEDSYWGGF